MTFPVLEESADEPYHRAQRRMKRMASGEGRAIQESVAGWRVSMLLRGGYTEPLNAAHLRWRAFRIRWNGDDDRPASL